MKNKILIPSAILSVWAIILVICTGCNKTVFDTTYTFNKANIYLNGEWKTIDIKEWTDYDDGKQLQIVDTDGRVYLTSSYNCTLIKDDK